MNKFGGRFKYSKINQLIDRVDDGITSNITKVIIRRDLKALLNQFAQYELCFGNRFNIKSTGFTINGFNQLAYLTDVPNKDAAGNLDGSMMGTLSVVSSNEKGQQIILVKEAGVVDYKKGEVILNTINITSTSSLNNIIEVQAFPESNDVIGLKDLYLSFDVSNSSINMVKDVIASGEDLSGVVFQRDYYTSSYSNGELERKYFMSNIDKRIQVNTIIENQLPEFVVSDFPKATEFLKQYFISQEFQGGAADLINNFDQYIKPDNLVPESVVGITSISSAITSTDTIIEVPSTKGFPSEYGLIKIDNEIISYTGITSTSFTGCIRGFSGISGYNVGVSSSLLEINRESLVFEETTASSHIANSNVTNLSVLFLQEFFRKLKATFLPGLENEEFSTDLDIGNFVKFSRSFYQSKGIAESIKILFKVLYGVDSTILDLEGNLIKPSSAEFIRREVIVADLITTTAEPSNLVGQTIFKSTDPATNASVSEVEVLTRGGKTYYKISLFVGFSDRDLIQGVFTVPGRTKSLDFVSVGSSTISVDSTVGFAKTGTLISDGNGQIAVSYTHLTLPTTPYV